MRTLPILLVVLAAGCAPRDREVRLARVAAEGRNLSATLDHLEDRLLANQARVRHWRELRERHESVSAIACASQQEHAEGMAVRARPAPSPYRARVAAAASDGKAPVRTGASY